MPTNPADGERRAMAGYVPQYTLAAALVLKALAQRRLEWIRVADPEAGRVDDFQLGTHNRVDAFQIKWSTYPGTITWSGLTRSDDDKPSLIRQLADGWQRLRVQRPCCRVVVHLVTNDFPSRNDDLPIDSAGGTQKHLAAFLAQAWNPWRRDPSAPLSSPALPWQYTMEQLRTESGLSEVEFRQFVADCELEFATPLPSADSSLMRDGAATWRDTEHIRSNLFGVVWSPQKIVELSCDELLRILGWTDHLLLKRKHEFPVEQDLYRPITDTVASVNRAIDRLSAGYLAVLGSPGSGKSTLLTHLLRYRTERVIKYYAYIPGSGEPLEVRGESASFLHDLVCQISETGITGGNSISSLLDRRSLQELLHRQLQVLGVEFASTGRKTVVLVDGLDHVPREYHPDRSFLRDLPLPSQIPSGVLFILGSQTDRLDDLPREVRDSVQGPDRRVEVGRLGKLSVHEIVSQALPGREITDEQKELIFRLCEGHPLALRYLLNRLADSCDMDQDLSGAERYGGSITANYSAYWSLLRDEDPQVADLLALMCRMRALIDMAWVATWADNDVLRRLREKAGHYFRRENEVRWSIFHNSFRVYVEYESAKSPLGAYDKARDQDYHRRIAEQLRDRGSDARHRLEELYHRAMQGDYRTVLQIAGQAFFRQQTYTGIPIDRVIRSIHWALKAAVEEQEPLAVIRLAFSLKEAHQRYEEQDEATIVNLLLGLGEYDSAMDQLCDGSRLVADPSTALGSSLEFLDAGRIVDATALFDLAEPLDVLTKRVRVDQTSPFYDRDALGNWAAAAVHFRGTDAVLSLIAELETEDPPDHLRVSREKFLAGVCNHMRLEAGEELLESEKWSEFRAVRDTLNPGNKADLPYWLRLTIDAIYSARQVGDAETMATELATLVQTVTPPQCDEQTRTWIAECIYRVGGDADLARRWIAGVSQPALQGNLYGADTGDLSPWRQRIRLNSLLYALVENHTGPRELVPDAADQGRAGMVLFERALCRLAQLRGRRWRDRPLARTDVAQEVLGLLRLFYKDWHHTRDWHGWNSAQSARPALYRELTVEMSLHGPGCLEQFMATIETEWSGPHSHYWPMDVKRTVVLEAVRYGMPRCWGVHHLKVLDDQAGEFDINGRVSYYAEQAKAWLVVGEQDRARACLERMRKSSVGVGYRKDYQSNAWIRRLREYLSKRPGESQRLVPWVARAVVTLEDTTEQGASEAAYELVQVAFEQSPRNAVRLARWFCERGLRWWHQAGLESVICSAAQSTLDSSELLLAASVDLLMPLATHVSFEQVPECLGDYLLNHLPREEALGVLDGIVSASDVLSLAAARQSWQRGLNCALQRQGIPERYSLGDAADDSEPSGSPAGATSPSLRLKSGEQLAEEEVRQKCSTFTGMVELLRESTDEHYGYNWNSLVRPLLGHLDRQQLVVLIDPLRAKGRNELLLEVGERLNDLGDADTARVLAEEVLASSYRFSEELRDEPKGRSATALLRRIDRDYARRKAYETVASEMTQHSYAAHEITVGIPAVLKLLDGEIPPEVLWPEIEDHLRVLFDEVDVARVPALEWHASIEHDHPSQALVDLLVTHAVHPCPEVRLGAMRGLARAIRAGCAEAMAAIIYALTESESQQWHLIRLVEALSVESPAAVYPLQSEIAALGASPNYAIRQMARAICTRLGWIPSPIPMRPELPASYHLWIPDDASGTPLVDSPPTVGEVFPDTTNPAIMIRPFHLDAEVLARMAGLEPNAVFARMAALMRQIEPFETWSAEAEKQRLNELKIVGPEFPYNRPRASVARRALFYVAAEIADAGRLSDTEMRLFFQRTRPHDPAFLLQCGVSRPEQLATPLEREYPKTIEKWREEGDPGQCLTQLDGMIVLAEDAHFKSLGDDHLKERRQSVLLPIEGVDHSVGAAADMWQRLHTFVVGGTVENYVYLDNLPRDLVIANRLDGCDSPGCGWVAANPAMARHFAWQYESGRWFVWCDASGRIAVKSLWWQDGLLDHIARILQCWVGEGWCVLAAREAVSMIVAEVGPLCRVSCITRAAGHDDHGQTIVRIDQLGTL